jgi:hypothetical protein
VPRQFARFAGTAYGHTVNEFFDKIVLRRTRRSGRAITIARLYRFCTGSRARRVEIVASVVCEEAEERRHLGLPMDPRRRNRAIAAPSRPACRPSLGDGPLAVDATC